MDIVAVILLIEVVEEKSHICVGRTVSLLTNIFF